MSVLFFLDEWKICTRSSNGYPGFFFSKHHGLPRVKKAFRVFNFESLPLRSNCERSILLAMWNCFDREKNNQNASAEHEDKNYELIKGNWYVCKDIVDDENRIQRFSVKMKDFSISSVTKDAHFASRLNSPLAFPAIIDNIITRIQ